MLFVDAEVSRENSRFKTTVHRRPNFSGVYTHFNSFLSTTYKFCMIYSLGYRCFKICSSWTLFHNELQQVKQIFWKMTTPNYLIDNCFKKFVENIYMIKQKVPTREKKNLILVLPSLGAVSLQTQTKLQNAVKRVLNCCQLRAIFKFQSRLSSVFRFNDQIPKELTSGVENKFQCGLFNETYYGETVRHLVVRSGKHISLSSLTNKKYKT